MVNTNGLKIAHGHKLLKYGPLQTDCFYTIRVVRRGRNREPNRNQSAGKKGICVRQHKIAGRADRRGPRPMCRAVLVPAIEFMCQSLPTHEIGPGDSRIFGLGHHPPFVGWQSNFQFLAFVFHVQPATAQAKQRPRCTGQWTIPDIIGARHRTPDHGLGTAQEFVPSVVPECHPARFVIPTPKKAKMLQVRTSFPVRVVWQSVCTSIMAKNSDRAQKNVERRLGSAA